MSDDDSGSDTAFLTLPPFSLTDPPSPFSTRGDDASSSFPPETPTDFPASDPPHTHHTHFHPSLLPTDGPTPTDVFLSSLSMLTLTFGDPTSPPFTPTDLPTLPTEFSSLTIDPSVVSDPPTLPGDPFSTSDFFSTSLDSSLTTDPLSTLTTFGSSSTTFDFTSTPSSLSPASSSPPPPSSNSFSTKSSQPTPLTTHSSSLTLSSGPFPPPVTQTSFPTFGSGDPAQTRASSSRTGTIVAASIGAIVFAIAVALLAILCRKRYLNRIRQGALQDPFLDLDGETVAVNQPLIFGDGPAPGAATYSDPFTDDSRPGPLSRTLSLTAEPDNRAGSSGDSHQAVVDHTQTPDIRSGLAAEYYNQHQPPGRLPPPPPTSQLLAPGVARSQSHRSLPQVQTEVPPRFPSPSPASPPYDAGAIAYLRYADQMADRNPPSPRYHSPGVAEDHRLISAFSVASELNPQYSAHVPPMNIDETLRNSPDPIRASSSYRPSFGPGQSPTPSVADHVCAPGDTVVISPMDQYTQCYTQGPTPGSENTVRGRDFGSRPSPIPELDELLAHSQEGSGGSGTWRSTQSGDTAASSPVLMTAERVQLTTAASTLTLPSYTASPGLSTGGNSGEFGLPTGIIDEFPRLPPPPDGPPPLPALLPVQPLSLGKRRSHQS